MTGRATKLDVDSGGQAAVGSRHDERVMQQKWTKQAKVGEIFQ
jgi:hypothetical protein